jgi:hypothetical protein
LVAAKDPRRRDGEPQIDASEQSNLDHPELDEAKQWIHSPIDDDPARMRFCDG